MTLQQLKYILAIEETGSISKAAELCNVAQPSLSIQLKKLEEELGVTIFDRSPQKGVIITEVGFEVLKQAKVVFQQISKLEDIAQTRTKKIQGLIKIGLIPTIAPFLLKTFIPNLVKKFPDLEISISESPTVELVHKLSHGSLDLAVLSAPNEAPTGLMERTLYFEPFFVFAAKGHSLLNKKQIKRADLVNLSASLLDETHCLRDQVEGLCAGVSRNKSNVQFSQGTLASLISIVDSQNSFTLLPGMALELLTSTQVKNQIRSIVAPTAYRKVSLVYHSHFVRHNLIDLVHQTILENLPMGVVKHVKDIETVVDPSIDRFDLK